MLACEPGYSGFYTVTREYNGSKNRQFVIRQYGRHYVGFEPTHRQAVTRIETQLKGRYVK